MANRYCCSSCKRRLPRDSFSNNQWRKGEGNSRCHACVNSGAWGNTSNNAAGNNVDIDSLTRSMQELIRKLQLAEANQKIIQKINTVDASQTARKNNATHATFEEKDLQNPFAQGSFRWVAKGVYTHGNRAGEPCVCKWFKTGGVLESSFYDIDLSTVKKALELITKWNSSGMVNKMVKINQPEVWRFTGGARAGRKILQEPFIAKYQKFNSNTGWADDSTPWPRVMQALSHYSYHVSNGTEMICDLQGGYYNDGVILTDPVVLSLGRCYGPTDLGRKGIDNFFACHTCNEFCRSGWLKPRFPLKTLKARKGTTMEEVPTVASRPQMSIMRGIHE